MKHFPLILIFVVNVVFQFDLVAQCTGALSLQLIGSSTGGNVATTITKQPAALTTISLGNSFTLSVSAEGSNLTYQWFKDNVKMGTAHAASHTVSSATSSDVGNYNVIVHGDCGIDRTSEIALVQVAPLPLRWLDFQTKLTIENKIRLDWITISETNVKHFLVERSSDGINFIKILSPIIANNSLTQNVYSTVDEQPFSGVNYYRIVGTDFDGKKDYSQVRSVNIVDAEIEFKIFPNPSISRSTLNISTNYKEEYNFVLTDLSGKIVYRAEALKGSFLKLNGINLSASVYFYEFKTSNKHVSGKIVVVD